MSADGKDIINNRNAFFEYHILDKYEAGIALRGTEVKSVMLGRIQLKESYVAVIPFCVVSFSSFSISLR